MSVANGVSLGEKEQAIADALHAVGYDKSLLANNVEFNFTGRPSAYLEPIPLAAFWARPFDQFTSAIGIRAVTSTESAKRHLDALGKYLWVPFSIIARPEVCELWETLPTNGVREPTQLGSSSYGELASVLKSHKNLLEPLTVRERKVRCRQMALFEVSKSPSAFFDWAFRPTREQIKRLLTSVLEEAVHDHLATTEKTRRLRWLLRFIAVRIALDKGWLHASSRTSIPELIKAARQYPTPFQDGSDVEDIAETFVAAFSSVNLSVVDSGLLSNIFQTHGLLEDLRKEWKLYPTPPDLAWRMVKTIPLEAIPEENRLIWDGTCGTGTLLVASMERLRQLSEKTSKEPERLSGMLLGNDREPLLADLTRISLDTALGNLQGSKWSIKTQDVRDFSLDSFVRRPTVIIGNPPFEATGPRADVAIDVLDKYIDILEPGGLLAIVLPRSILGTAGRRASELRERLLKQFEIYELWELPQGFAPNVSSEAAIICGRKRYQFEAQRSAIAWRLFKPGRHIPPFTEVVSSPDVWLLSKQKTIESPLMLKLRTHFQDFRRLSDLVNEKTITEGIRTGTAGNVDVLTEEEAGARPFLRGRTNMAPFYIPWRGESRRWIRYDSPRLDAPRRQYEDTFQRRKVLVARWSTGGSPWASQAAVDETGLYPSDDFISISPESTISCELIAGLFNSALMNCWIRMSNPSRTIRVGECAGIPIPKTSPKQETQRIQTIAKELANLRCEIANGSGKKAAILKKIVSTTLKLDENVYDIYQIPEELRAEISAYFRWHDKPRPGFDTSLILEREVKPPLATEIFTSAKAEKLKFLLQAGKQRTLTKYEGQELDELVALWEQAQMLSAEAALKKGEVVSTSELELTPTNEVL